MIDVHIETKQQATGATSTWWPQFRVIDTATVTPDPEVAAVVAGFEHELDREIDVPLGTTAVELDSRNATVRTREAAIGNLIADAMRDAARADVAIMNGGGIRGGKVYPPGTHHHPARHPGRIAVRQPRGDDRESQGGELRRAIENGLSLLPDAAGRFPQVSGLTVEVDPQRPAGSRVVSIKVGGAPLDRRQDLRVATNDFMARGGDGYAMFRDARRCCRRRRAAAGQRRDDLSARARHGATGVEGRIAAK